MYKKTSDKCRETNDDLFIFDKKFIKRYGIIAGMDEAGRGPLAGPVVTAIVISRNIPKGVNDSKKLTQQKREELFQKITTNCDYAIGISSVEEIDTYNILGATKISLRRALSNLKLKPQHIIIDGKYIDIFHNSECIIEGDSKSSSIASASIIAKVYRDNLMKMIHEIYPQYNFQKNKGYGTREHMKALENYGPTPLHRLTYKPVKKMIKFDVVKKWMDDSLIKRERLFKLGIF